MNAKIQKPVAALKNLQGYAIDATDFLHDVMGNASHPMEIRIEAARILAVSAKLPYDDEDD